MYNLVVKVRYRELGPLNWTCCNNLQWHWPYNVCVSVESSIKRLLWYLSTMQRNYKLVWMLSLTQKKTLSKQKPHHCVIPAFGPTVNRCKVQTTELCICPYSSAPEQGTVGSQPSEAQQKKCLVLKNRWEEDAIRDNKQTQSNILWGCAHWHNPCHWLGANILTKLIDWLRILRKDLTGSTQTNHFMERWSDRR